MKVKLLTGGLIILPETEFEAEYLRNIIIEESDIFHKCGISAADYIGLKIKPGKEKNK